METRQEVETLARTFLDAMKLTLSVAVTEGPEHVQVDLSGPDSYLVLERKGAVMEALQLLMAKVGEARFGLAKRLVIDCEGYRRQREEGLVKMALEAADRARTQHRPVELDPLNPYERRVVHMALADQPGVASRSEGEGFIKRIVISPV